MANKTTFPMALRKVDREKEKEPGTKTLVVYFLPLTILFLVCPGCVSLPLWSNHKNREEPPVGEVVEIVPRWERQVIFLPDPGKDGQPGPNLAMRLYLFDKNLKPCRADGFLEVKLSLEGPPQSPHDGKVLECWAFNKEMLCPAASKDRMIGWGYNVPLPWATYQPNLTKLQMNIKYTTKEGNILYKRSKLKLAIEAPTFNIRRRSVPGISPDSLLSQKVTPKTELPGGVPSVSQDVPLRKTQVR
ncbi:MAG: hypothetical protein ACFCD0_08320 [Gemmataceae bacterium]